MIVINWYGVWSVTVIIIIVWDVLHDVANEVWCRMFRKLLI